MSCRRLTTAVSLSSPADVTSAIVFYCPFHILLAASCVLWAATTSNHSALFRMPHGWPHIPSSCCLLRFYGITQHNMGPPCCQLNCVTYYRSHQLQSTVVGILITEDLRMRECLSFRGDRTFPDEIWETNRPIRGGEGVSEGFGIP